MTLKISELLPVATPSLDDRAEFYQPAFPAESRQGTMNQYLDFATLQFSFDASPDGTITATNLKSFSVDDSSSTKLFNAGDDGVFAISVDGMRSFRPTQIQNIATTIASDNIGKVLVSNTATNYIYTLELNDGLPLGSEFEILVQDTGGVNLQAQAGVTLDGVDGNLEVINVLYQRVICRKVGTNAWLTFDFVDTIPDLQEVYSNGPNANTNVINGRPVTWTSTTEGIRPPSMTNAQANALVNPLNGTMVWESDATRMSSNRGTPGSPDQQQWAYLSDVQALEIDAAYGETYYQGNATETVIAVISTPVKVAGTYNPGLLKDFTQVAGALTFTGTLPQVFDVSVAAAVTLNLVNADVTIFVAKNGTVIPKSSLSPHVGGASPGAQLAVAQGYISLIENDTLEIFVQNNSDTNNITVQDLQFKVNTLAGGNEGSTNVVISWDGLTSPTAVTAGTNMDVTGGSISTVAEVNVVALWDGVTTPVNVTAGANVDITSGIISATGEANIVTDWDSGGVPVAVTAGADIDITNGVISYNGTSGDNVVTLWDGVTTPVAVTGGKGISITSGDIAVESPGYSTGGVSYVLGAIDIPRPTYDTNLYEVVWDDFQGTNIIEASSMNVGDTIEADVNGVLNVNMPGPNADAGSSFRVTFGSTIIFESNNIPHQDTTTRTRIWNLNIKLTRIAVTTITASVVGYYFDFYQQATPIEIFLNPTFLPFDPFVDNEFLLEYRNGNTFTFDFVAKNMKLIQHRI